jgi:hypothetical protein
MPINGRPTDEAGAAHPLVGHDRDRDRDAGAAMTAASIEPPESDYDVIDFWEPCDSLGFLASFG